MTAPRIAISLGDPCGIGPEITARALSTPLDATVIVHGSRDVWQRACEITGVNPACATLVHCHDTRLDDVRPGTDSDEGGRAQAAYLESAAKSVLSGDAEGLCTAPVNKAAVARVMPFVGHTEYLQELFGVSRVVMLMAGPRLRVALATNHVALRDVADRITVPGLVETGVIVARELGTKFGIASPRLCFLAVNPHAGDGGHFGDEDDRLVSPAIAELQRVGIDAEGPFPADGFFSRFESMRADAVIAAYHDQGLIPFKLLEGMNGVNVTLGLPKPRTSPDHGVAYDVAGKGVADPTSMRAALELCVRLAKGC